MQRIQSTGIDTLEGIARVVHVAGDTVWLEPEQTSSCGECASSATCGSNGIGSLARRLETRRLPMHNTAKLVCGERVVLGMRDGVLVGAALIAYGIPLLAMLVSAGAAQLIVPNDTIAMAAAAGGLLLGLGVSRLCARWLVGRGALSPRLLRRVGPTNTDTCRDAR